MYFSFYMPNILSTSLKQKQLMSWLFPINIIETSLYLTSIQKKKFFHLYISGLAKFMLFSAIQ